MKTQTILLILLNLGVQANKQIYFSPLSCNSLHILELTNLQTGLLFVQILRNDIPIYTEKIMHL